MTCPQWTHAVGGREVVLNRIFFKNLSKKLILRIGIGWKQRQIMFFWKADMWGTWPIQRTTILKIFRYQAWPFFAHHKHRVLEAKYRLVKTPLWPWFWILASRTAWIGRDWYEKALEIIPTQENKFTARFLSFSHFGLFWSILLIYIENRFFKDFHFIVW